jgi:Nif-specific regulatory protein
VRAPSWYNTRMELEWKAAYVQALLNSQRKLDELMPALIDIILDLTGAERGFLLLSGRNPEMTTASARSRNKTDLPTDSFQGSTSIIQKAMEDKETIYIPCLPIAEDFSTKPSVRSQNLQSVICLPLFQSSSDVLLGVIYLDSSYPVHPLTEEHLQLLKGMTNHLSLSIENAQLFQEISRLNDQLQNQVEHQEAKISEMEVYLEETQRELGKKFGIGNIVGRSPAMQNVFRILERVVKTDAPVLIQGESGTGKELIARHLHHHGSRSAKQMFSINCAAFNETLLESELFGHRKGAFTGADQNKMGIFQIADGGTLFLDEVGEMSSEMQKKLLRVLQDGEFLPVGGKEAIFSDARIIAATNKNLEQMVEQGKFRDDLYFRLNVIQIQVPPLRERVEDIPLLIDHHSKKIAAELRIAPAALTKEISDHFLNHHWPGNIRELENELRRFYILGSEYSFSARKSSSQVESGSLRLDEVEKRTLSKALEISGGNKTKAAEVLDIPLRTLYDKLKRYGLN